MNSIEAEEARRKTKEKFNKFIEKVNDEDRLKEIQLNVKRNNQKYYADIQHADQRNRRIAAYRAASDSNDRETKTREINRATDQYEGLRKGEVDVYQPARKSHRNREENYDFEDGQDYGLDDDCYFDEGEGQNVQPRFRDFHNPAESISPEIGYNDQTHNRLMKAYHKSEKTNRHRGYS